MSRSQKFLWIVGSLCLLPLIAALTFSETPDVAKQRETYRKAFRDGNYKDAYIGLRKLCLDPASASKPTAEDVDHASQCLQNLDRTNEVDEFLESTVKAHPNDWRVLHAAAQQYLNVPHHGYLIAGKFERGNHRGGGQVAHATERDRVRALQLYHTALTLAPQDDDKPAVAEFFLQLSAAFLNNRGVYEAWRMQLLSDLTQLPDHDEGWPNWRNYNGAPVDEEGKPLYFTTPKSWDDAKNDGERWRWAQAQAVENHPPRRYDVQWQLASFFEQLYGVQSMQLGNYGRFGNQEDDDDTKKNESGVYALHTLSDQETIAKLATGIKRFTLPDEFNSLLIYRALADEEKAGGYREAALNQLAEIYANRRQYPVAAKIWKENIERFGPGSQDYKKKRLEQIVGNWGQFQPIMTQPAREGAKVDFRFRNAKNVKFTAQSVKAELLLEDVKKYLKSDPGQLDWNKTQIDTIGWNLASADKSPYLGEQVAEWSLALEPREAHFDRRITVTTPLQTPGCYMVTASVEGGNVSKILMWVADTAIIQKPLNGKMLYYVADSITGKPIAGANLEFFGFRQEHLGNNRWRVHTSNFAEVTGEEGTVTPDPRDLKPDYQWLTIARSREGRFAFFGFTGVWGGQYHDREYNTVKVFTITDRPVYRPLQKVQFKLWVRKTQYDQPDSSDFAKQSFPIEIHNPKGEKIYNQTLAADEYGGLKGEISLPADAPLGMYQISVNHRLNNVAIHGGNHFRVEEYKKPEFEVSVIAPTEPVMLGEKITAKIEAKYYFGSPVAKGKVKYKIMRSTVDRQWYPSMPWDWCYGQGYWWFAYEYEWYPGWHDWVGCKRPFPWWGGGRSSDPPELIAEVEKEIGPDGKLEFVIDTQLAKELHANADHEYSITAEVRDESRRVIVGTGKVLVARKAFRIFSWVDRGYYRVGDEVTAHFKAQTLDNKPVKGRGELRLFKIDYKDDEPVEALVETWRLDTDDEGLAERKFAAAEKGQYRLSYQLTDSQGHKIEGAYIFTIVGQGFNGRDFKYDPIELIPDRAEYKPGEKVRLQINVDRADAAVLLFIRPANGVGLPPKLIRMQGKSVIEEIDVIKKDMPNFFVEAVTVADGKVFNETKEIVVPPEKRVLNVEVVPSSVTYKPGEKAKVKIRLTDFTGENFVGSTVMTIYDKAVEYISGGSNVPDIKEFFWKWRRTHHPRTQHNLTRWSHNLTLPNKPGMENLGIFGHNVVEQEMLAKNQNRGAMRKGAALGATRSIEKAEFGGLGGGGAPAAAALADAASFDGAGGGFGGGLGNAEQESDKQSSGEPAAMIEPTVRTKFADTAYWTAALTTDANGLAEVEFDMPENLSGWKIKVWGMGHGTKVGSGEAEVVTRKNLLIRLQAPRFFVQKDEVVLSANVHNYLDKEKEVTVVLDVAADRLKLQEPTTVKVKIPAGGEKRVDWRCIVLQEGETLVRMKALTDEESDAMELKLPSYVHGMLKTESWAGTVRPDKDRAVVSIKVPKERRVEQSLLEVRYSPTLAGAMLDALPYLAEYPYGCTEQTLNRFLPSVITQKTLLDMRVNLAAIRDKRTNLNAQEIGDDRERAKRWKRFDRNPVFEEDEVDRMVKEGLKALTEMQLSDGGWGWFSGSAERSFAHTTAVVVHGLQIAKQNDVPLVPNVLERGVEWLKRYQTEEIARLQRAEKRQNPWKASADNLDALVYMILVDAGIDQPEMRTFLYRDRNNLSVYAKSMFGLALHNVKDAEKLAMILKNIEQFIVEDAENESAYLKMPNDGYWWYWYGSETEANAYYLKLLAKTDPKGERAPRLVKYLLNNRKHATYWNSTRDTALCVEAFADFIRASGEMQPDLTVEVWIDGKKHKEVAINADNLFTFDNKFVLAGADVTDGAHEIELRRRGKGPLYFNAYLTNFTLEDDIKKAGLEVKVERNLFKLKPVEKKIQVQGTRSQAVEQRVEKYERIPLENLASLTSGDLVEVELVIESKNDYEYLMFEDMKGAGFEPMEVRSGYNGNAMGAYVEFRDNRVTFFVRQLARGKHSMSYRLRAEIPGKFAALPAKAEAMYAPELRANSDEIKLRIEE